MSQEKAELNISLKYRFYSKGPRSKREIYIHFTLPKSWEKRHCVSMANGLTLFDAKETLKMYIKTIVHVTSLDL